MSKAVLRIRGFFLPIRTSPFSVDPDPTVYVSSQAKLYLICTGMPEGLVLASYFHTVWGRTSKKLQVNIL